MSFIIFIAALFLLLLLALAPKHFFKTSFIAFVACIAFIGVYVHECDKEENTEKIIVKNSNDSIFVIPFREGNNGCKYINVKVGNQKIKALFDTGCSSTIVFSSSDYNKLIKKGALKNSDLQSSSKATMANGDNVDIYYFNLDTLKISNNIFLLDIEASILEYADCTILGIDFFNKFKQYTIDNENNIIICKK